MQQIEELSTESSYSSAIIKVAVSQICQSVGFKAAENSALNTMTDIAIRYLQAIAKSASSSANSLNRTQCNVFDIVVALEELGLGLGFKGGSEMRVECLLSSSVLVDLERFMVFSDEIPFAKALRRRAGGGDCLGLGCGKKGGLVDGVKDNDVPFAKVFRRRRGYGCGGDCVGLVCQKKGSSGDGDGDGLVCGNKGGGVDDVVKVNHVPRWLPEMPVMGMEDGEEEGRWEEGWKCCGNEGREELEEREKSGLEFGGKKGEVKEQVRKGMRDGVSRSGGCGKRVLCGNHWKTGNGGVEKKRVMITFKKRLK